MKFKHRRILLTGATGFVGSAVQQQIIADAHYELTVVARRIVAVPDAVRAVQIADFTAQTDWGEALQDVDIVIHSAARVHVMSETAIDPLVAFRKVNVDGTLALARQAAEAGVQRFVFISSIGVNGAGTQIEPFTEVTVPAPHSPYAVSKLEAEVALQGLCAGSSMELVIIRPPLVYAAHAPGNFSRLLKLIKRGFPMPFLLVKNQRSMIALENLVDFILHCVKHPEAANQIFLIADRESVSTPQMLRYLSQGMGKSTLLLPMSLRSMRLAAKLIGREAMFNQLCGSLEIDTSKARSLLGWKSPVSVEEAMRKTGKAYLAEP